MTQEADPLHIGNLVGIESEAHGPVFGRVVYRDINLVRIMPQEASDRAIEFAMTADGSSFAPELGVTAVEIIEEQESDFYVDFLGAKPGETLEFFTVDGAEAAPSGIVDEVIKSATKDSIKLTDGRLIKFRGRGPPDPIAVVRVLSELTEAAADPPPEGAEEQVEEAPKTDILALLRSVLPSATVEVVPTAERSYPDSMQREDLFQDLLAEIPDKQRTNPRRIRFVEREVDLAVALKNKSLLRDTAGRVTGPAPYTINTIAEAVAASIRGLPAAIPVVGAARVLNLDRNDPALAFKQSDVAPRVLSEIEHQSEDTAKLYLDGALPSTMGRGFYAYTHDLLNRDGATLQGQQGSGWREDQDVIRTASVDAPVQGLSKGLPAPPKGDKKSDKDDIPVDLAYLISDVTDRSLRVLGADIHVNRKTGEEHLVAPSDPSYVASYMILPPKASLSLRPPRGTGLASALLYSAALEADNLPTIAQTLRDVYTPDAGSPLNAWTLSAAGESSVADWLKAVLKYAVHPVDSQGPRSGALLGLLDTLGLGTTDLAPAVAGIIWDWTANSQEIWRSILKTRRADIQTALDAETPRTFQSATGIDAPLWAALRIAEPLKEILADIGRRNPTIADAPTLMTASLLQEAQGDAAPLVWAEIIKLDSRPLIDVTPAIAALAASRTYTVKRKVLRDAALLALSASPEVNPCPHAARLEAVRNVRDVLQRSRLLRDFIEEFQGPKEGEWMTCVLCSQTCICYHELMELEALAQPSRMDAIQKQILIKYGGDRYEGKITCRNCGQALQDIDYDDHVEFDDSGRPIATSSVLTAEQMEEPTETVWKKSLAPPPVVFATQSQRDIGDALQLMIERGGLQVNPDVIHQIVRYTDLYVSLRAPPADVYEKQRTRMLTAASTKIKTATGIAGTSVSVPTYTEAIDQLRVSALIALTAIAIQSAEPAIVVNNPFPLCQFSRGGYPFDPTAKPDAPGALVYMACVVASIQKDIAPWRSLAWSGDPKLEPRQKKALHVAMAALQIILGADPKSAPLSFTPEIRQALTKAQTDVVAHKKKAAVSRQDQLPPGFRPEPFPPALARPNVERNPLPAIEAALAEGKPIEPMFGPVATAMRQQSIAIVSDLHEAATKAIAATGQIPSVDAVCCPVAFGDATSLQGMSEQMQLLKARNTLRGAIPTAVNAGTHLWSAYDTPIPEAVEQVVEEGVFFKLFLKYCYVGSQVGEGHEFSTGNLCRQCGLALGKPLEFVDFSKEGAAILAAQQGDLRIEVTQTAFDALSEAVRRRKTLRAPAVVDQAPWRKGLDALAAIAPPEFAATLGESLAQITDTEELDEISRATLWTPFATYMDGLRAEVISRIGQGRVDAAKVLAQFDTLTEDPFIEGPRAVQEYWCAKVEATGTAFSVRSIDASAWSKELSQAHTSLLNKVVLDNSSWYGGSVTKEMLPVLQSLARSIGPLVRAWIRDVRPATGINGPWTVTEAQMVLRTIVLQGWRDALITSSPFYAAIAMPAVREKTAEGVAVWTRSLMLHVKQQFIKYSKETIKRILQDRAGLERDTIVEEFESIKDDDVRAAELLKKQFRIGRWAGGANLQKYDADTFEFENEQRKRMGIMDQMVEQIVPEAANAFGFGADAGPEEGYEVGQGADGDDY